MADGEIQNIPLGKSAYKRRSAHEVEIQVINRFFEQNPTNQLDQVGMLLRPGLKKLIINIGTGPIRKIYKPAGQGWAGDIFVVSGNALYRVHRTGVSAYTTTLVNGVVAGTKTPSLVASDIRLFVADGSTLQYSDGVAALATIATPDATPTISIDYIAGFIIAVQGNSQRFYWLEPGSIVFDPLNFAEAERTPDPILNVTTIGDQFWLFGRETTEVWYPTGDSNAPFLRIEGRLYDRGIWEGTAIKVKDEIILVGADGIIYSVTDGPKRISTNGIEERVRRALATATLGSL